MQIFIVFVVYGIRVYDMVTAAAAATDIAITPSQGKDLPAKDLSGTSDPYVRVTLLPDKKHRLETKIKRRTLNPRWNETFYFEGFPIQKLNSRVLHLHVFDYDRFSRDDSIGEVFLPLCQVCLHFIYLFLLNAIPFILLLHYYLKTANILHYVGYTTSAATSFEI